MWKWFDILLAPLALLFFLIISVRNKFYDRGLFKQHRLSVPVLCVGNITTGGTGKTPWVEWFTYKLGQEQQKTVAILSRGYSGDYDGVIEVTESMDPRRCGDEPLWLKRRTKSLVYVGRKRVKAARKLLSEHSPDLILLDDGFQHRALGRDLNVILLDASVTRSHYRLLPIGRMREGFAALKRADKVIINKCNYADKESVEWLKEQALRFLSAQQIYLADFVFDKWQPLFNGPQVEYKNAPSAMCCGIGNPKAFRTTLKEQGVPITKEFIYPDHYYWIPRDIEKMTFQMKQENLGHLLVTDKDAVKLSRYYKHFLEMGQQIWSCQMKVEFQSREGEFFEDIRTKLHL